MTKVGNSTPQSAGGLVRLGLSSIFRCAVELAEATATVAEQELADLPVNCEGPTSPHYKRQEEATRRLQRIEDEAQRLKRALGATGPLEFRGGETDDGPQWESYETQFDDTDHNRIIRLGLFKVATAAIDLSGFTTWRELHWYMRETGLRLLAWGLAQLWDGMSEVERSKVRTQLSLTHKAIGWPVDPATDPPAYNGPEEIPLPDKHRIIKNYVSCYRNYPDDVQKAEHKRVEKGQERFLRNAKVGHFLQLAERAAQALRAMANKDFDSVEERGDLYTKALESLACLRRALEVQPREVWPSAAMEQRRVLADAANVLLICIGGTPEAKSAYKPADADDAFAQFKEATRQLKRHCDGQFSAVELEKHVEPRPIVAIELAPIGFLGGADLADALGVHPSQRDAFFKQLERKRIGLDDKCWQEVSNRRANSPRFQYRVDSPKLRELAEAYKTPKPA